MPVHGLGGGGGGRLADASGKLSLDAAGLRDAAGVRTHMWTPGPGAREFGCGS